MQTESALPCTVDIALARARDMGLERLDAQLLLAHVLGRTRTWLLAYGTELLNPAARERFVGMCEQRLQGQPVSYLTGEREFYGLRMRISPDVLDPRPDTEVLVDWALSCLKGPLAGHNPARVADLGTGSGAIALAIKHQAPRADVWGVDSSAAALAVAAGNSKALGLGVNWRLGDWLSPLQDQIGHLLVSNPPYLKANDPHLPALHAEPQQALVGGEDGLDAFRQIVRGACNWLQPEGWLLLEHGFEQGPAVADLLIQAGFEAIEHRRDLAGHIRCTGGRWPTTAHTRNRI